MLMILDGLGLAPASRGNAVSLAQMPVFNKLITIYPTLTLRASGEAVGLRYNEIGNSEVGHLNLGAGKIVWQSLPRIDRSIVEGDFFKNEFFLQAINWAKEHQSKLHLIGLVSNGEVHSSIKHLFALLELVAEQKFDNVFLHAFLDGRDTAKDAGLDFISQVLVKMKKLGIGRVASLSGRFFSMDRDNQWDRIEKAYSAMTSGQENQAEDPVEAIKASYRKEIYDEHFEPTTIVKDKRPVALIEENDAIIYFNFRADRARELTEAFVIDSFQGFDRAKIQNLFFVTMTEYEKGLPVKIAFPKKIINYPLARVISDYGLNQFHVAETQKYAHVTFFFNGGREEPYPGEERKLIPSPVVASFAEKPEMSAPEVAQEVIKALEAGKYSFIVVNFANPDMVGHTGNIPAAVKCLEVIDDLLGKIIPVALANSWTTLILADHGNIEQLINPETGEIDKEHTTNPVPFIIIDKDKQGESLITNLDQLVETQPTGILADVAPTILKIMGLKKPAEMTGISLI